LIKQKVQKRNTKGRLVSGLAFLLLALAVSCSNSVTWQYPESKISDHVETLHGVQVADPYRWLEDLNSEETGQWVEAQARFAREYLDKLPELEPVRQRLTELWDYEKYGVPRKKGNRYFFTYNDGLQNQSVLYWSESLDEEPRILLDPNTLSEDGTVALTDYQISPDGRLMAFGTSEAGSDWQSWRVREVDTGRDLADEIRWIKFSSVSWTADSRGFFYSRYDEPTPGEEMQGTNFFQKIYFHRIGDAQTKDRLVYERPDQKKWGFNAHVTEDGRYLTIRVRQGTSTQNGFFYRDLKKSRSEVVELLGQFDARYDFVGNRGPLFWFLTDLDAPRARLIEIDIRKPARELWKTLIPESDQTLQNVSVVNQQFICSYLEDAHTMVRIHQTDGEPVGEIELPGIGTASGFDGHPDDTETFYSYTSFTVPVVIYRYDLKTGESTEIRRPKIGFDPADYETRQVFCTSRDGTRIPMFISHRKGLQLNGYNPTLLYGYGGFNISITPRFSVTNLVWMEKGGIYVLANLRGGGEYGEQWHQAGMKLNKQNVFDDFIAAAEYLIEQRYTSNRHLAITGASNGGLLVGAVLNQRPELFAAAVPRVGVMDMLRFHHFTIGWAWVSDYGSPENEEEFRTLYAYSPYHNINPEAVYPPTLIMTADHDDRVVPSHSFKYGAALQAAQKTGPNPILLRIETRAGHGSGKPTSKRIEEAVDMLAFLIENTR